MEFNPAEPFPLVKPTTPYQDVLAHSAAVDSWLGFEIQKIESDLAQAGCRLRASEASGEKQQLWLGLAPTSLQTPYSEIRELIERLALKSGSVISDLGAAYGRMGFVVGKCFPQFSFIGYEYVGERVQEFKRCSSRFKFPNVKMIHADLSAPSFQPQASDVFFIYDYGTPKAIRKTLYDLQRLAKTKNFSVVIRGLAVHEEVQNSHPWLVRSSASPSNSKSSIFHSQIESQALLSSF
jgi:precorrin-6B methylase 2